MVTVFVRRALARRVLRCIGITALFASACTQRAPENRSELQDCVPVEQCPELVVIPTGTFLIGSPVDEPDRYDEEGPQREIAIATFAIGKYPVTRGEWAVFVASTDRATDLGCEWTGRAAGVLDSMGSWRDTGFEQDDSHPVVCVTWNDAQDYLTWLSERTGHQYRLPSEAEWEYAARAGTRGPFPWGDTSSHEYANHGAAECCAGLVEGRDEWMFTSPVAAFPANSFGVHDMHGNTMEWVEDCFSPSYESIPSDGRPFASTAELHLAGPLAGMSGTNACDYRMLRGGDWGNPGGFIRSAARNWAPPPGGALGTYRSGAVGFRVARDLE